MKTCYHESITEIEDSRIYICGFIELEYQCDDCNVQGEWSSSDPETILWDDPCEYE